MDLSMFCALLQEGSNGIEQPRDVKSRLVLLEKAGYAVYERDAWRLTREGKARKTAFKRHMRNKAHYAEHGEGTSDE